MVNKAQKVRKPLTGLQSLSAQHGILLQDQRSRCPSSADFPLVSVSEAPLDYSVVFPLPWMRVSLDSSNQTNLSQCRNIKTPTFKSINDTATGEISHYNNGRSQTVVLTSSQCIESSPSLCKQEKSLLHFPLALSAPNSW